VPVPAPRSRVSAGPGPLHLLRRPQASIETGPNSINNGGQIVGSYVDADVAYHGFLRDKAGRFTTIDIPGAKGTGISRINDRGQIAGRYSQTHANIQDPNAIQRGFLLDHGRLTRMDVPGAAETQAVGINNRGQVVGEYQQPAGVYHCFLLDQGRYATFDTTVQPSSRGTSTTAARSWASPSQGWRSLRAGADRSVRPESDLTSARDRL
jgi:uncharacterized membrane protein